MARPRKAGLSYFPLDVDIFDADYKIIDLLDRFGPKGFTVYIAILCMVYREGYYLEIPTKSLQAQLGKMIGNRWLTDKTFLTGVIDYCGELGLFDVGLLSQGVITSAGIQRRYREATKRNKSRIEKYRLLEEDPPEAGESAPETSVSAAKTGVSSAEMPVSDAKTPQRKENKRKENKRKENSLPKGREKETPQHSDGDSPPPAPDREPAEEESNLYGRFRNVRLTREEYAALGEEVEDRDRLIEQLSAHMEATGARYKNHFARLLKWEMEDHKPGNQRREKASGRAGTSYNLAAFDRQGFDLPEMEDADDSEGSKRKDRR